MIRKNHATPSLTSKYSIPLLSRRSTAATLNGNVGKKNKYYIQSLTSPLSVGPRMIVKATPVGTKNTKGTTIGTSCGFLKKFCNSMDTPSMPIPKNQSMTKRTDALPKLM